ncbi:MAG TPA: ACT domain-containing protein, partial [Acidimicrobiales bacterium]|nr:ACT domain-containing protein [Acidimicrobiales bacterium]
MASVSEVKSLLLDTTVPRSLIDESLDRASTLWLMSASAPLLAGDVVLCHPPVRAAEVRAAAHPLGGGATRLTVVAHDRPGLLADTAGLLAADGLSVGSASAMSWAGSSLAVHALTVVDGPLSERRWHQLGLRLRQLSQEAPPAVAFTPLGRATVTSSPSGTGRSVVTVTAPDQVGLLWAICRWFADHGVTIEAARCGGADGQVEDHFVVVGEPDSRGLAARLTEPTGSLLASAAGVAGSAVGLAAGMAAGVARTVSRRLSP